MKSLALTAIAVIFTTSATASDLCVNYVSGVDIYQMESEPYDWVRKCDGGKCAFASFNPYTRTSLVVTQVDAVPYPVVWEKGFGAVMYGGINRLEWKLGAVPTLLPPKDRVGSLPNASRLQTLGKLWQANEWNAPAPAFDAPANRRISAGDDSGDTYLAFGTPITWTNTETGEEKVLTIRPVPDSTGGTSHPLQISTADNFILIADKFDGGNAIVADMNTGEVLLRAGDHSRAAGWGKCPSK